MLFLSKEKTGIRTKNKDCYKKAVYYNLGFFFIFLMRIDGMGGEKNSQRKRVTVRLQ